MNERSVSIRRLGLLTMLVGALVLALVTRGALDGADTPATQGSRATVTGPTEPIGPPQPEPNVVATALSTAVPPPTAGRWIEVDVGRFSVRLMRGSEVLRTIEPVAVGAQIDTGAYESTQTGLFAVYSKIAGLTYDAPYHTYIDWWVGFDPDRANGFHTFLLDEGEAVVDASTGRVSNGCIRTGAAREIFEFAEIGMPVLVHT